MSKENIKHKKYKNMNETETQTATVTMPTEVMEATKVNDNTPMVEKKFTLNDKERNLALLPTEEVQRLAKLTSSINVNDINSITNYGCESQSGLSRFTSEALKSSYTKDLGEIKDIFPAVAAEIRKVKVSDLEQSPFKRFLSHLPLIRHLVNGYEEVKFNLQTIEKNLDDVIVKIKVAKSVTERDNTSLSVMFKEVKEQKKNLEDFIIAGKLERNRLIGKYQEMKEHEDDYEPYELESMLSFIDNFDAKIHDLSIVYTIAGNTLSQILMLQKGNISLSRQLDNAQTQMIPLWKVQMAQALAINRQKENAALVDAMHNATDKMMVDNAKNLKDNMTLIEKSNNRGVVSIDAVAETLQVTQDAMNQLQNAMVNAIQCRMEGEAKLAELRSQYEGTVSQTPNLLDASNADVNRLLSHK